MLSDFISLIFPTLCAACGKGLNKAEEHICTSCLFSLPQTNYHLHEDNPVARLFWGRAKVERACAYYHFVKEGKVQELIHQFKYKGQKEVGQTVGKHFAHELNAANWLNHIDVIIPVPLHAEKYKKRGYNQSDYFAKGISEVAQKPVSLESLIRTSVSETQTRKSRYSRWKNVETIFNVPEPEAIRGKHILLVDDVVTTGSTLEACVQKLLGVSETRVSIATMAYASL